MRSSTRRDLHPREVPLHQRFLDRALPSAVALDDRRLKAAGGVASALSAALDRPSCAANVRSDPPGCPGALPCARTAGRYRVAPPRRPAGGSTSPPPSRARTRERCASPFASSIAIPLPSPAFPVSFSMGVLLRFGSSCPTSMDRTRTRTTTPHPQVRKKPYVIHPFASSHLCAFAPLRCIRQKRIRVHSRPPLFFPVVVVSTLCGFASCRLCVERLPGAIASPEFTREARRRKDGWLIHPWRAEPALPCS